MDEKLYNEILELMDELAEDTSIPRNWWDGELRTQMQKLLCFSFCGGYKKIKWGLKKL